LEKPLELCKILFQFDNRFLKLIIGLSVEKNLWRFEKTFSSLKQVFYYLGSFFQLEPPSVG